MTCLMMKIVMMKNVMAMYADFFLAGIVIMTTTMKTVMMYADAVHHSPLFSGNNLDFSKSMPPTAAKEAYSKFVEMMRGEIGEADKVKDGRFGTMMEVDIVNDGPVTVQIEWPEPSTQKKS